MARAKKACFDRILQRDLHRQQQTRTIGGRVRAIGPKGKQWVNGSTLKIRMNGGTPEDRTLVESVAEQWTQHANLHFAFTEDPRAEIRVTFDENDGAWSYIGLDNKTIPLHAATLNLGWVDQGVILHEFGHMIGLAHEHSNSAGGIQWNEAEVIRDLSGPPNYWDEETIRHNVLMKYSADQVHGTEFDPDSIMLYAFPKEWTIGGEGTHENSRLSKLDRDFVRSEKMYPGRSVPGESAVDLALDLPVDAGIEKPGEEGLFRFRVEKRGQFQIETLGTTDVVLSVFGPTEASQLIATDDDSGDGRNARVRVELGEGIYFARVLHYDPNETGNYGIVVPERVVRDTGDDYGVVVGIDSYTDTTGQQGFPPLTAAERDATSFRNWLVDPDGGRVPEGNVRFATTSGYPQPGQPLKDQIDELFQPLVAATLTNGRVGERLYIYLAGHGFSDPQDTGSAAMLAANATFTFTPHVAGTRYAEWFRRNGTFDEIVLIMDCCRSVNPLTPVQNPPFALTINPKQGRKVYAFAVEWGQESRERTVNGQGEGIFTAALLQALKHAPADRRGRVTGQRLKDFVHNYLAAMPNGDQLSPPVIEVDSFRDIVFVERKTAPKWKIRILLNPSIANATIRLIDGTQNLVASLTDAGPERTTELEAGFYKAEVAGDASRSALFEVVGTDVDLTL